MDQSSGKVARQRNCSIQYNPNHLKMHPQACFVLFASYLSLREEGASELLQVTTGLHGLLKLTSDVVLTRTRNSLMGSRQQEVYSKYKLIFVVTCPGNISFHVVV